MRLKFWQLFILLSTALYLFINTAVTHAQNNEGVTVTIRLRNNDGTPVIGEQIMLLRPPENEPIPPTCTTDENGECSWFVGRGIYTLQFANYSLDANTSLAVAEGGLTGLSITVGNEDIVYNFAVANEDKVYNDLAPESSLPDPFIPELEDVVHTHDGNTNNADTKPLATPVLSPTPPSTITPVLPSPPEQPSPTDEPLTIIDNGEPSNGNTTEKPFTWERWWPRIRIFLVIGAGLLLGWAAFMWQQRRSKILPTTQKTTTEETDPPLLDQAVVREGD